MFKYLKTLRNLIAMLAIATVFVSCDDDGPNVTGLLVSGDWELVSLEGNRIPFTVNTNQGRITITSWSFEFDEDGEMEERISTNAGPANSTYEWEWREAGKELRLRSDNSGNRSDWEVDELTNETLILISESGQEYEFEND